VRVGFGVSRSHHLNDIWYLLPCYADAGWEDKGPQRDWPLIAKTKEGSFMITLGVILLIIGFIAKIPILWTLGIILVVAGVILALLGSAGRAVGGRRHYY
jgi:hypothetical protein